MLLPLRISEAQKDTIVPAHCLLPPGHKAGYVSYTQTARRYLYSSDSSVRPQDYFLIAEARKDTSSGGALSAPSQPQSKVRFVHSDWTALFLLGASPKLLLNCRGTKRYSSSLPATKQGTFRTLRLHGVIFPPRCVPKTTFELPRHEKIR